MFPYRTGSPQGQGRVGVVPRTGACCAGGRVRAAGQSRAGRESGISGHGTQAGAALPRWAARAGETWPPPQPGPSRVSAHPQDPMHICGGTGSWATGRPENTPGPALHMWGTGRQDALRGAGAGGARGGAWQGGAQETPGIRPGGTAGGRGQAAAAVCGGPGAPHSRGA